MSGTTGQGYLGVSSSGSDYNAHAFLIKQMIGKVSTNTLVQVMAVTNDGNLAAVGFVDVMPLVNQLDGAGNATPHGTIHHIPYFRLQGGANAIILDPQVGDIGIAAICDRDVSSVKANKGQANPGSRRRFDLADGLYIGGVLNQVPTQFIQYNTDGITVTSTNNIVINATNDVTVNCKNFIVNASEQATLIATTQVNLEAPLIALDGDIIQTEGGGTGTVQLVGPVNVTNEVTGHGTPLSTHVHGGVTTGGGDTGIPIP